MRILFILFVLLYPISIQAQGASKWNKIWKTSLAVMAAASFADTASSYGKWEVNPILAGRDGRFGAKGLAIKGGITGGFIIGQILVRGKMVKTENEKREFDKKIAYVNFACSAAFGGLAAYNLTNSRPANTR